MKDSDLSLTDSEHKPTFHGIHAGQC